MPGRNRVDSARGRRMACGRCARCAVHMAGETRPPSACWPSVESRSSRRTHRRPRHSWTAASRRAHRTSPVCRRMAEERQRAEGLTPPLALPDRLASMAGRGPKLVDWRRHEWRRRRWAAVELISCPANVLQGPHSQPRRDRRPHHPRARRARRRERRRVLRARPRRAARQARRARPTTSATAPPPRTTSASRRSSTPPSAQAPRRSTPATASSPRTRRSRRHARTPASSSSGRPPARSRRWARRRARAS